MNKYSNIDIRLDDPKAFSLMKKGVNLIINWSGTEVKVHKYKNTEGRNGLKTLSELRGMKLMPDAPPVGYGLQQYTGEMFYLFNPDKTKPYAMTEIEKIRAKEYRSKLKQRKTCPICKTVYKTLEDVYYGFMPTPSLKEVKACKSCHDKAWEEHRQQKRSVKHDFISYFINKGIELNIPIGDSESFEIVYLDFETTGLSPKYDEVLQASMIDDKDRVLLYKLFKPVNNKTWDEAMDIHNITPADVENEQPFESYVGYISDILIRAKTIVCYNVEFEIGFLNKYNVKYSEDSAEHIKSKFEDPMLMFADVYGEWNEYFGNYKWQKLTTAARYYNYNFDNQAHNSLADVFATKFIYEKMKGNL